MTWGDSPPAASTYLQVDPIDFDRKQPATWMPSSATGTSGSKEGSTGDATWTALRDLIAGSAIQQKLAPLKKALEENDDLNGAMSKCECLGQGVGSIGIFKDAVSSGGVGGSPWLIVQRMNVQRSPPFRCATSMVGQPLRAP